MIIDIVIIVIVIFGALIGASRGLFKMLSGIISLVLAFVISSLFYVQTATFITDTFIKPKFIEAVNTKVEELGGSEFTTKLADTILTFSSVQEKCEGTLGTLLESKDSMLQSDFADAIESAKQPVQDALSFISESTGGLPTYLVEPLMGVIKNTELTNFCRYVSSTGTVIVAEPLYNICYGSLIAVISPIVKYAMFLILFPIIRIVCGLIFMFLKSSDAINTIQRVTGGAIGMIVAIVICYFAICALNTTVDIYSSDNKALVEQVNSSFIINNIAPSATAEVEKAFNNILSSDNFVSDTWQSLVGLEASGE